MIDPLAHGVTLELLAHQLFVVVLYESNPRSLSLFGDLQHAVVSLLDVGFEFGWSTDKFTVQCVDYGAVLVFKTVYSAEGINKLVPLTRVFDGAFYADVRAVNFKEFTKDDALK